jgi:hypothetical protein
MAFIIPNILWIEKQKRKCKNALGDGFYLYGFVSAVLSVNK